MFKGKIYVTGDPNIIYNAPINIKIVSMDEDDILVMNDNIIQGTCLLPPVEAKIAEADGNEMLYDTIYSNHLLDPYQYQFIGALLSYLYKVGDMILFLPELECCNTVDKFIQHMYILYGVHIGKIDDRTNNPAISTCYYDNRCIPIWLNMMYMVNTLSCMDFLYLYPDDAAINNNKVLERLLNELAPYGKNISEQVQYIDRFRKLIKNKPNLKPAIRTSIRRNL